jgi:hypothetical protein
MLHVRTYILKYFNTPVAKLDRMQQIFNFRKLFFHLFFSKEDKTYMAAAPIVVVKTI